MAITRTTYSSLLGFDPVEEERNRQKLWAGLYAGASSPWEKVGIGIGQLAGGLFGGESAAQSQAATLQKIAGEAAQLYTPNSAEYFTYIADKLPDSMSMVKTNAMALATEAEKKDKEATRADVKFVKENPEAMASEIQPLATKLENKAKLLYAQYKFDPASGDPIPEEIQAKLEKTPEYKKIMEISQVGQQALIDKQRKEEKSTIDLELAKKNLTISDLDIKSKNLNIEKLTKDLAGLKDNVLSSRAFFEINGLDYTKPLDKQNIPAKLKYTPGFMPALISAQQKALEGSEQAKGTANPSKPAAVDNDIKSLVEAKGETYQPNLYDYRVVNGQVQRKKKQ